MRCIIIIGLLLGCSDSGMSEPEEPGPGQQIQGANDCDEADELSLCGLPHTTCTPVEGGAPCCSPPDPRSIECPEGTELHVNRWEAGERGSIGCAVPGGEVSGSNGPLVAIDPDQWVAGYGDSNMEITNCWPSGLIKQRSRRTGPGTVDWCRVECYDEGGEASDHCLTKSITWCDGVR